MGFASRTRKRLEVEDDGRTLVVNIRRLSGNTLEDAQNVKQLWFYQQQRAAGPETVKALQDSLRERAAAEAEAKASGAEPEGPSEAERRQVRYQTYDVRTVVTAGVESIDGPDLPQSSKGKVDLAKAIESLTSSARREVFEAIVDLEPLPDLEEKAVPKDSEPSSSS